MSTISQNDGDDLGWLAEVLGGPGAGPSRPVLCRPSCSDPQFLVPLAPRAAASASLRRHHDARTARQRLEGRLGRAGARLGGLRFGGGEVAQLPSFSLVDDLAHRLGEHDVVAAITLGPRRRNRKPVLQLVRGDGEILCFAKVGWNQLTRGLVRTEAETLRAVAGRLPATVDAPRVLAEFEGGDAPDGQPLIVVATSPLDPARLGGLPSIGHRSPPAVWLVDLARSLGTTEEAAPTVATRIAEDAIALGGIDDEGAAELRDGATHVGERFAAVTLTTGLWHGDLTPWNTITGRRRMLAWDWEFGATGRPIGFDLLHGHFETIRRRGVGHEHEAVDATAREAADLLAPAEVEAEAAAAVADLHALELLSRELRLQAGGDLPEGMGDLRAPLRRRLAGTDA